MLFLGQNLTMSYGIKELFNIKKLEIYDGDRIGLVGQNGCGKSTLLNIISGLTKPDDGTIKCSCNISVIPQFFSDDEEKLADAADKQYISKFNLKNNAIKSGGEQTRLALAKAFSSQSPLLLADEPTTNLDQEGISLLESMLLPYKGAILLVSHDRTLLDNICTQIWEIENGSLTIFPGNYSDWLVQKSNDRQFKQFEHDQYISEKKKLTRSYNQVSKKASSMMKPPKRMGSSEWILYKSTASIQQGHVQNAGSALKSRIEHLEKKDAPSALPDVSMKLSNSSKIKSKTTGSIKDFTISFGDHLVLSNVSITIPTGKKVFITGDNGSGKTTLLMQFIKKSNNTFITKNASIAYFSQNHNTLDFKKTVLENVLRDSAVPEPICRAVLINLYFSKLDLDKNVNILSGGERTKVALAKVLVSGCNFLILDEPTNHIDIYTMESLEQLLESFDGTLLCVSHDRRFTKKLADIIYTIDDCSLKPVSI